MKKLILGVTALAGLMSAATARAVPLDVTVGGDFVSGAYLVSAEPTSAYQALYGVSTPNSPTISIGEATLFVNAEGTLDNGILAGLRLETQLSERGQQSGASVNSDNGRADISQAYGYMEGKFGRMELGGTYSAAYKMHFSSPWFTPDNGVDYPNMTFAVAPFAGLSGRSLSYATTFALPKA